MKLKSSYNMPLLKRTFFYNIKFSLYLLFVSLFIELTFVNPLIKKSNHLKKQLIELDSQSPQKRQLMLEKELSIAINKNLNTQQYVSTDISKNINKLLEQASIRSTQMNWFDETSRDINSEIDKKRVLHLNIELQSTYNHFKEFSALLFKNYPEITIYSLKISRAYSNSKLTVHLQLHFL